MNDVIAFPFAQRVVALAAEQVGIHESGGANKGPPIDKFAGGRSEPWCAHFVAWLYRECGIKIPGDVLPTLKQHNPIARVQTMWTCLEEASWVLEQPMAGAIIVFRSRMDSDPDKDGWHCGVVSSVTDKAIQTIEGNSHDKVARRGYQTGAHGIEGFAFPHKDWARPAGCRLT